MVNLYRSSSVKWVIICRMFAVLDDYSVLGHGDVAVPYNWNKSDSPLARAGSNFSRAGVNKRCR